MNIIFLTNKLFKKTSLLVGCFFLFLLIKSSTDSIEDFNYQANASMRKVEQAENAILKKENQKLSQTLQEIYQPFNNFLNCPLCASDPQVYQNVEISKQETEIFNLQSRYLKGKMAVEIKKTVYNPHACQENNNSTNSGKIVLISIHGTMSSWQIFGYGKSASSIAIQNFAAQIAQIYALPVELLVINWGGELSQKRRLKVGMALGDYIASNYHKNDKIWGLGHSHGCNILNNLAERLRAKNMRADKFLCIAPIALDIKPNHLGLNIDECYNFYSCGDVIQAAGSSQNGASECVRFFPQCPQTQSYCIQVFPNNEEVDHLTIKIVVLEQLTKLICQIKKNFPIAEHLNVVLFKKNHEPIIVLNEESEGFDSSKYISKFFKLSEFDKLIEKQNQINEINKNKLAEMFGKSLFPANSQIKSIFKGLRAIIQQRSKYAWLENDKH
jgi:hypothetical protein